MSLKRKSTNALPGGKGHKKQKARSGDSENQKLGESQPNDLWELNYFVVRNGEQAVCLICRKALLTCVESNIQQHFEELHEEQFSDCTGEDKIEILKRLKNSNCLPLLVNSPIRRNPIFKTTKSLAAVPLKVEVIEVDDDESNDLEQEELNGSKEEEVNDKEKSLNGEKGEKEVKDRKEEFKDKLYQVQNGDDKENEEMTLHERGIFVSYLVSLKIASEGKNYSQGQIIKRDAIKYAKEHGNEQMIKDYEMVALSRNTVNNRISDISNYILQKTKCKLRDCRYFSLLLHENFRWNHLLIFARIVQSDFTVSEDLLTLSLLSTSSHEDAILKNMKETMNAFGNFRKCSAVAIRSTRFGKKLLHLMEVNGITCPKYQCQTSLETLARGELANIETIRRVQNIANLIRSMKRKKPSEDMQELAKKTANSYNIWASKSKMQWLCENNFFEKIFKLREDVGCYLQTPKKSKLNFMEDSNFLSEVAFLADLTMMIDKLTLNMQLAEKNVVDLIKCIQEFREKLQLMTKQIKENDLSQLPCCCQLPKNTNLSTFLPLIEDIIGELDDNFQSLNEIEEIKLLEDPRLLTVKYQQEELQTELENLRKNVSLMRRKARGVEFFKMLKQEQYPKLQDLGLKLFSMFGSMHICASVENIVANVKLNRREPLISAIEECVRIAISQAEVNILELVRSKQSLHQRLEI